MKNYLFAFILLSGFTYPGYSQTSWGLKAGFNTSNIRNTNTDKFSKKTGFDGGLMAKTSLGKYSYLQAELLLSEKGGNSLMIPTGTTSNNLSYLSLPVLMGYRITPHIYVLLGPELSFLAAARVKNDIMNDDVTPGYKQFDFSLAGGPGIIILKKFCLETRYILGLTQLNKNESFQGSSSNRAFQLNLIYWFL